MDNNQKIQERIIVDLFRKNYPEFPAGKLVSSESPDFILKIKHKKTFGIEITELNPRDIKHKQPNFHSVDIRYIDDTVLQCIIDAKSEKIKLYKKKKTDKLWLIIFVDAMEGPETYNLNNKIENWKFNSGFDKVYLFDLFSNRIWSIC